MDMPPILAGIRRQMDNLSDRQRVIAQNIANSETPGFKARTVEDADFSDLVGNSTGGIRVAKPRVELTAGMKGLGAIQPAGAGIVLDKDISETKPDGNNVTLEDQLLKLGQVQADFTAMTNLYRKQISMLKTAVGKGG
ncbi:MULTISPECIES: flagellar basal body protein [Sphingomonas]|uniref:Flagellar basal body rod protein FlgB n=1 Tax=Sphingomonas kyeonggiensis TaxID=1268553 RepID=A0A7W7K3V6_9SPHN|nr:MULTISPECIES: flagellar basal body protein [Sphingomonas]MBB4840133.1 flagellar basal-body rod protein FlgB [Sphingomonas kyeonggiensis]WHU04763.1 flagellar basal body protein [Sphingomonas sp. NIBR02145]|eukprot:TRINITY_DN35639_c0_g1_i1.p2 TRINITY_DN35639_c0_g1~~TRINITY_DN35639_c0_g1_i1.p2  ORF type:complete len:138 (+),score=37.61 TRINITY_DN35639_c0_g1_i1:337-750(+)